MTKLKTVALAGAALIALAGGATAQPGNSCATQEGRGLLIEGMNTLLRDKMPLLLVVDLRDVTTKFSGPGGFACHATFMVQVPGWAGPPSLVPGTLTVRRTPTGDWNSDWHGDLAR